MAMRETPIGRLRLTSQPFSAENMRQNALLRPKLGMLRSELFGFCPAEGASAAVLRKNGRMALKFTEKLYVDEELAEHVLDR